jgi:hypothetical protein
MGQCLSSFLHEIFILNPKTNRPRPIQSALLLPLLAMIQVGFVALDRFVKSETFTIGYTVVAQKAT